MWGREALRSNAARRRRSAPPPPPRFSPSLMRQRRPQVTVNPRPCHSGETRRHHRTDAGADQGEDRSRAGAEEAPADPEDQATDHVAVAAAQHLGWNGDGPTEREATAARLG